MADFEVSYTKTGGFEGNYSNHPADTGGETWCGVARKKNPSWDGWKIVDSLRGTPGFPGILKRNKELESKVHLFYKKLYWDKVWGDQLVSQIFANMIYGSAVNHGVSRAIKMYQTSFALGQVNFSDNEVAKKLKPKGITYGVMDQNTLDLFNASNEIA